MNQVEWNAQLDEVITKLKDVVYPEDTAPWITEDKPEEKSEEEAPEDGAEDPTWSDEGTPDNPDMGAHKTLQEALDAMPDPVAETERSLVDEAVAQVQSPPMEEMDTNGEPDPIDYSTVVAGNMEPTNGQFWTVQDREWQDEEANLIALSDRLDDHVERTIHKGRYF